MKNILSKSKESKKIKIFEFKYLKINYVNGENDQSARRVIKYHFLKLDDSKLTYAEFVHLLKEKNEEFLKEFREALNHAADELSAYFWECIPVSQSSLNKEFEFVVTESLVLYSIDQDYSNFKEHIEKTQNDYVTNFSNLGGDSILVIPTPQKLDDAKKEKAMPD
jgi:hypothetical protein